MSRGIVYCAQGERHFLEALASAKSSLQHNAVPHVIFSDRELGGPIPGIDVRTQHGCGLPFADKIDAMTRSPFAQTIYLDTDTFVAAEITELFELLERFDIAAAHAPAYLGFDPEIPRAFYELNTGVIAYRERPAVKQLLADWRQTYLAWVKEPPFELAHIGDEQPVLRRCLWRSQLSVYVIGPEYNYRTTQPGRLVGPVRIIHGRPGDYPALVAHLNQRPGPRTFPRFSRPALPTSE